MDLFLKIIGGLTLAGVLLLALFVFFIWRRVRNIAKGLAAEAPTPSTIDLTPDADPSWTGQDPAARDLAAFEACGYVRGPVYTIDGMPGVSLVALHHPATGTFGSYYAHPAVGNFSDLCANFADGLELTVCTAPSGQQLDTRPNTKKIFLPGKTPAELHAVVTEHLAGRALKHYAPENFKAEFCAAYARDMAWRQAKDGTSEEEFRRISVDHKDLTDEQLKEAFKITKRKELDGWSEEILGAFEKTTTLSVAEWKKYERRMIIFRDGFHPVAYLDYLTEIVTLQESELERYQQALDGGLSLSGLLARITADAGYEFIKLGEVAEPSKTEIYGVTVPPDERGRQ